MKIKCKAILTILFITGWFDYHHQPINVSTAGAQAFILDYS
jgi:uncharacterized membrane protein